MIMKVLSNFIALIKATHSFSHSLKLTKITKNSSNFEPKWDDFCEILFNFSHIFPCISTTSNQILIYSLSEYDVESYINLSFELLKDSEQVFERYEHWEDITDSDEMKMWHDVSNQKGFIPITTKQGKFQVVPVQHYYPSKSHVHQIRIIEGMGWGNGQHPTTKMCLNFIEKTVKKGDSVIDYGTGSGILSIASLMLGATDVTAVDIDDEVLEHAKRNFILNGFRNEIECQKTAKLIHTKSVQPNSLPQADVVVANILVGPLIRLAPVLSLAVKETGILCVSGFRECDRMVLQKKYCEYIDWDDGQMENEEHKIWGEWKMIVGRPKVSLKGKLKAIIEESLSELAVS